MSASAKLKEIETDRLKKNVADVRAGETVRVHYRIREGNKERVQVFEGLVIAARGGRSLQASFTVRKVSHGVGVERTFPLHSPWVIKIERVRSGKARQAKLYFVRKHAASPKKFRLKDKGIEGTIWEEVAAEQKEIEKAESEQLAEGTQTQQENQEVVAEVAKSGEDIDNNVSDETKEESGNDGGESSNGATETKTASDSSA